MIQGIPHNNTCHSSTYSKKQTEEKLALNEESFLKVRLLHQNESRDTESLRQTPSADKVLEQMKEIKRQLEEMENLRRSIADSEAKKTMQKKKRQIEEEKRRALAIYRKLARGEMITPEERTILRENYPVLLQRAEMVQQERSRLENSVVAAKTKGKAEKLVFTADNELFEVDKEQPNNLKMRLQRQILTKKPEDLMYE